jgi:DNA-binding response OmpR family regulator
VAGYGVLVSNTALLLKPFLIPELAARIRAVLDGPRQHEVAESTNGAHVGSVR